MRCVLLLVFLLASSTTSRAQDTRRVTQPVFPPPCQVFEASLSANNGGLAEADESKPDTERIQEALNRCRKGRAVVLKANGIRNAFLTAPLQLRPGVTLLVDTGVTLFGSRNPRDYDVTPGSCGIVTAKHSRGCKPLILGERAAGSAIMGDGTIDGRGGSKLLGQSVSWWDLAQEAKVKKAYQACPRLIVLSYSGNFTLYRITLKNSPNFHVYYGNGNGFTAWGVIINTPKEGRNTDGIDPANSQNVTITRCFINTGDDNIAIKAGAGAPTRNMTIANNHFYSGHGMSIGSETEGGASAIRVSDLTIDGADNGLRIKSNASRGGLVQDVRYENVCIRNTKNPIFMDSNYSFFSGEDRSKRPWFRNIVLRNVRIDDSGRLTFDGYDAQHHLGMTLDNVTARDPGSLRIKADNADITVGPGPVNFSVTGEGVRVLGKPGNSAAYSCQDRFLPMLQK